MFETPMKPDPGNRRSSRRARIAVAVKQKVGDRVDLCQAGDISPSGIFVASADDTGARKADRCLLEFSLPGSDVPIQARGKVVRRMAYRNYHLSAIRFSTIAPSHRRLIQRYVDAPPAEAPMPPFVRPPHYH